MLRFPVIHSSQLPTHMLVCYPAVYSTGHRVRRACRGCIFILLAQPLFLHMETSSCWI